MPSLDALTIREATQGDAEAMAALFYHTIRRINSRDYGPAQIDAWAGAAPDPNKWRARLGTRPTLVACLDGVLVGFSEFEPDGHIDTLYVHHAYQGRGIASRLLERIEREAASLGVRRLYTEASITARPFFERRGFAVVEAQQVRYRDAVFTNYKMEKIRPDPVMPCREGN